MSFWSYKRWGLRRVEAREVDVLWITCAAASKVSRDDAEAKTLWKFATQ